MATDKRRVLRMSCKGLLLLCLPLAGFVWALPEDSTMLAAAGVLTVLSLAVGFGAEYLASSTENDLRELDASMAAASVHRSEQLKAQDERLRQLDRIVSVLEDQNNSLRGKLVSLQVQLQQGKEALLEAASGEAAKLEEAAETLRPAFSLRVT